MTRLEALDGAPALFSHRGELFGAQFAACLEEALRHATEWSVWEVELFAAFVSKRNHCGY